MRMSTGLRVGATALSFPAGERLGPELVTNGTFDTDATGWTVNGDVALSVSSGKLRVESTSSLSALKSCHQAVTVVTGEQYRVTINMGAETETSGFARCGNTVTGFEHLNGVEEGTHTATFTAPGTTIYVSCRIAQAALSGEGVLFDNISVRKIL